MDFCWMNYKYDITPNSMDNSKLREKVIREYDETVRRLVEFVEKRDKRVKNREKISENEKWMEEERERKNKLEIERMEGIRGTHKESESLRVNENEELYPVVCGKNFKSEKQKKHEHKEMVADLRNIFGHQGGKEEMKGDFEVDEEWNVIDVNEVEKSLEEDSKIRVEENNVDNPEFGDPEYVFFDIVEGDADVHEVHSKDGDGFIRTLKAKICRLNIQKNQAASEDVLVEVNDVDDEMKSMDYEKQKSRGGDKSGIEKGDFEETKSEDDISGHAYKHLEESSRFVENDKDGDNYHHLNKNKISIQSIEDEGVAEKESKIRSDSPQINKWKKGELLGRGVYGSVHEGFAAGGHFFAVKEIRFASEDEDSVKKIQIVIDLLKTLSHLNIVQYYGTEKGNLKIYIFHELVYKMGPLDKLYKKYKLEDSHVSAYTLQILTGLKYLHDNNVIHRDIRCANILVDVNGSVKIADFGLAKVIFKLDTVIASMFWSFMETIWWMAPEVINQNKGRGYGVKADIWSLGCTVLEMLTRQRPYPDLDPTQALIKIGNGVQPHIPASLSTDARDFIKQCIQVDPIVRPSAAELLSHPFLKGSR